MAIGQWESSRAVIENSRGPGGDRMAGGAGCGGRGEPGRYVIGYISADRCGALKSRLMAAIAILRTEGVIVVHMAGRAGGRRRRNVRSRQYKSRSAVIE